ncbi:YncE family protein [Chloroflexota bacterium]
MTKLSGYICLAVVLLLPLTMFWGTDVLAEGGPNGLPSGGRLFVVDGDPDSYILELDPSTGAVLNGFPTPVFVSLEGLEGLAYCNGRMFFVTTPGDAPFGAETIYEINPETGAVINSFPAPPNDGIDALGLSTDRLFASDFQANTILVLNPDNGALMTSFSELPPLSGGGTFAGVSEGAALLFTDVEEEVIFVLDASNGELLDVIPFPEGVHDVYGLGFSASRNTLFLGEADGPDTIYEVSPVDGFINSFPNPPGVHISAMAADECVTPSEPVGGELYPVNKLSILAPFLTLALLLALGGGILVVRRRQAS